MPVSLPVFQHPTLTVLVDDSDSFLRSLSFQLDPNIACCAFADTRAALEWLRRHAQTAHWPATQIVPTFDTSARPLEQCGIAVDINEIYRVSFRPERFMTPSVVVVDYSMPQMNGIEFCKAISHLACKKILFTGAADEKIAVDAFNRGLIDRYIKKSDDDALERLEVEVRQLQARYFAEQSDSLRDVLVLNGFGFVYDPAFTHLAREVSGPLGIVEHYLYPNPSGLLMYDANGVARLLVVETDASMRAHIEVARDSKAPPSLVAALEARKIVPFFHGDDGMYSDDVGDDWLRYCQGANICQGVQRYYWALFDLPPGYLPETVRPFSDFLLDQASRRVCSGG
ncbi:response regulator [Massilia arenosa]|uniref:Response regulator n=1 Tax=Zemynaea arenosa TaxID=2561931 RepID=A0A4Y9RZZ3_9BURK|nr:response regulator [Massilia arenosa]TFW13249.1 response regulator [Massilia arenosa]